MTVYTRPVYCRMPYLLDVMYVYGPCSFLICNIHHVDLTMLFKGFSTPLTIVKIVFLFSGKITDLSLSLSLSVMHNVLCMTLL